MHILSVIGLVILGVILLIAAIVIGFLAWVGYQFLKRASQINW